MINYSRNGCVRVYCREMLECSNCCFISCCSVPRSPNINICKHYTLFYTSIPVRTTCYVCFPLTSLIEYKGIHTQHTHVTNVPYNQMLYCIYSRKASAITVNKFSTEKKISYDVYQNILYNLAPN